MVQDGAVEVEVGEDVEAQGQVPVVAVVVMLVVVDNVLLNTLLTLHDTSTCLVSGGFAPDVSVLFASG